MPVSDDDSLMSVFGRNLRLHRERKGWSQSELARQMVTAGWPKYSQVAVSRTEDGTRMARLDEALALSRVVGTTIDALLAPPDATRWAQELSAQLQLVTSAYSKIFDGVEEYATAKHMLGRLLKNPPTQEELAQLIREHGSTYSTIKLAEDEAPRGKESLQKAVGFSFEEAQSRLSKAERGEG